MNHQSKLSNDHKDLVCGMTVASEDDRHTAVFEDKTYYFCDAACREKFEKSPNKYLNQSSFFLKRWWDNYLRRLNKVTGGKSQCCH